MHLFSRCPQIWHAAVLLLCVACASSTPMASGTQTRTLITGAGVGEVDVYTTESTTASLSVAAPVRQVWAVLPQLYQELDVPLTVVDTVAMQIGNAGFKPRRLGGTRLSRYLDCGRGITATPNADAYEVTMTLLTKVLAAGEESSTVQVQVTAFAKPRDVSGNPIRCASRGTLETQIAERVHQLVAASP